MLCWKEEIIISKRKLVGGGSGVDKIENKWKRNEIGLELRHWFKRGIGHSVYPFGLRSEKEVPLEQTPPST